MTLDQENETAAGVRENADLAVPPELADRTSDEVGRVHIVGEGCVGRQLELVFRQPGEGRREHLSSGRQARSAPVGDSRQPVRAAAAMHAVPWYTQTQRAGIMRPGAAG